MNSRVRTVLLLLLALPLLVAGAEVSVPPADMNSVGPDQAVLMQDMFFMCGDLVDTNDAQTFFGPAAGVYLGDYSNPVFIGSDECDAMDSETEAGSANAVLAADLPAFKVTGFYCIIQNNGLTDDLMFTLRSDGADTTPVLTCTISAGGFLGCGTTTATTTDIAAGGTLSMQADYNQNLDARAVHCQVFMVF